MSTAGELATFLALAVAGTLIAVLVDVRLGACLFIMFGAISADLMGY